MRVSIVHLTIFLVSSDPTEVDRCQKINDDKIENGLYIYIYAHVT